MRNYIEIKGLAKEDVLYTTTKGSKIKITNVGMRHADAEIIEAGEGCSPKGSKGRVEIANMPGLRELLDSKKQRLDLAFSAKYPNMDSLLDIINGHADAREEFNRMMESGDSVLRKSAPEITVEKARAKYPEEAAYMAILRIAEADPSSEIGYIRRRAGGTAIELLLQGVSAIRALASAEQAIDKETGTSEYKEHCMGL